jgi:DNA-binding response OmpR family regulator
MRVLVIEDEERLAEIIQRVLQGERFDVDIAHDGQTGLDLALSGSYDALIVDRMLPALDGLEVVRQLRSAGIDTGVVMLTARGDLPERVEGLDAGADDYLGKPFAFSELIARLQALLRRADRPVAPRLVRAGNVSIDLGEHLVTKHGQPVDLTQREFSLLELLMRRRGRVVSRDEILERVWGYDADPQGNVVELYIHYLRKKIDDQDATAATSLIRTVRGAGYQIRSS